jgi:alkylmercury lyase-like protein
MTQPAGPDLNKCCAAAALTGPARQVHLVVLAAFTVAGEPPPRDELERIARAHGGDPGAALAELAAADVIAYSANDEIRAAYPFSPVPTPIRVRWAGGPLTYAMCAIDALGMSAMLGRPVTITAAEPGTGRIITVHADGGQARWNPRAAVVFAGAAGELGCPSADRSCGYTNFFTSARAARAWARRHPEVTGTVMNRQGALNCGIAEFGTLLPARGVPARRRADLR